MERRRRIGSQTEQDVRGGWAAGWRRDGVVLGKGAREGAGRGKGRGGVRGIHRGRAGVISKEHMQNVGMVGPCQG